MGPSLRASYAGPGWPDPITLLLGIGTHRPKVEAAQDVETALGVVLDAKAGQQRLGTLN